MFEKIADWVEENPTAAVLYGACGAVYVGIILWAKGVSQGYNAKEQEIKAEEDATERLASKVAEKLR